MDILGLIKTRRAVRRFKRETIAPKMMEDILEAGRWAPSGLNNQPWKFKVLEGAKKNSLAEYTVYSSVIRESDRVILIFLDKKESYHYEKDLMAIGACIENMLLYIHSVGLGACWLGEILSKRDEIIRIVRPPKNLELEAVIVVGRPLQRQLQGKRYPLAKLIVK